MTPSQNLLSLTSNPFQVCGYSTLRKFLYLVFFLYYFFTSIFIPSLPTLFSTISFLPFNVSSSPLIRLYNIFFALAHNTPSCLLFILPRSLQHCTIYIVSSLSFLISLPLYYLPVWNCFPFFVVLELELELFDCDKLREQLVTS